MPWRDRRLEPERRVTALLGAATGDAACKRLGAWLDAEGEELKPALVAEGRRRGVPLPDEALFWPGKRLVRRARAREAAARERRNPIRRDGAFTCAWCGADVPAGGARVRDHCPWCLRSRHVDRVPGDRAAGCGGILQPAGATLEGRAGIVIAYRCDRCGHVRHNRAVEDGPEPDDPVALRLLLAQEPVPPSIPAGAS